MAKKEIVLIPHWIQETLKRNQLPLTACLELKTIRPLVALSDLIAFCALQERLEYVLGAYSSNYLFNAWMDSFPSDDPELKNFFLTSIWSVVHDATVQKDVHERLFVPEARISQYEEPFITYDLTPTVLGVVIYPGFFVASSTKELQRSLIAAILKVLYVYSTYSEVAKTSLFKRYLELLSPL